MDRLTEQAALVALLASRRSGWAAVTDEVESRGSSLAVLVEEAADTNEALIPLPEGKSDLETRLEAAREAIRGWTAEGLGLTTVLDTDYPTQLLTIHERPPFLFYRGDLRPYDADGVAVVGTRKPTARGLRQARGVATGLAERGVVVVSGLAAGIDTAVHTAALDAGGRTVGVLGTGLRQHYPAANRALQDRIGAAHLLLSQFWPDAPPSKLSFPMRNAIMSGYSAATVVIEASYRSGARMQARLALEHGRPVLLMRTLLEHDWARSYSERAGVYVVGDYAEVLSALDDVLAPTGLPLRA